MGRPAPRWLSSCACALLAGCAQLAGIDETSGLVPPEPVSLEIERISIGATVVRSPQDLSMNMASFLVLDDSAPEGFTRVPGELTSQNLWTAEVPDGTPLVQFDLPDFPVPKPRLWQLPSRSIRGQLGVLEHSSPTPAPAAAMITIGANLPSPYITGESFQFFVVGTWNNRGLSAAELPAADMDVATISPVTFPFSSTNKLTGREHEKITAMDAVLLLRYTGPRLSGVMEAPPFDQTGSDTIMGTMTAIPDDLTLDADLRPAMVAGRYAPLRPAMTGIGMSWGLTASPGVDVGDTSGISLHSGSVATTDPPLAIKYGNPFVPKGWRSIFLWQTSASRSFTPAGQMLAATLTAALYTHLEPTAAMTLTLPAALPELVTIDGVPLSSDGVSIEKPTRSVTVGVVANGAASVYAVVLYELVPNTANTALVPKLVIAAIGLTKELTLPPELFVPGKVYTLRAVAYDGGFTNAATGDLATRAFPISVGAHDSGVFTVTP